MWNSSVSSTEEMDILDVDEELKDDSLFAREDKTHDDVCNILQQWKMNMQPAQQQQQQQQQEQDYKLNSKTFTRPKKRSLNFSGMQTSNESPFSLEQIQQQMQNNNELPYKNEGTGAAINLQIGGYVTNMHKSFLSDTSPPPSMDMSLSNLNNSLITSADFSNISFLQSTHEHINLDNDKDLLANDCGYTFNDLLRDRKALDSLTLSADGTLIKDSSIAQIDDISLALSKTTSSCSTMDNSTNSVESSNLYFVEGLNKTFEGSSSANQGSNEDLNATTIVVTEKNPALKPFALEQTMVLGSDMIADTTFNLDSISIIENEKNALNVTRPVASSSADGGNKENERLLNLTRNLNTTVGLGSAVNNQTFEASNETFKKPSLEETQNLIQNTTFEMQNKNTPDQKRCETPENQLIFCISTPQTQNLCSKKQQFSPSLYKKDEVNISPIIGSNRNLNETYEYAYQKNKKNSETFTELSPQTSNGVGVEVSSSPASGKEKGFNQSFKDLNQENLVENDMFNLVDLANVEAKLLAANDDGVQFEHMLEELSKVHMIDDHNKMKKSIESIKKRLSNHANSFHMTRNDIDFVNNEAKDLEKFTSNLNRSLNDAKNDHSPAKDSSTLSKSADRLLSRRSRLYDNINISSISENRKMPSSDIMSTTFGESNASAALNSTISNSKSNNDLQNTTQSMEEETGKLQDSSDETAKQNSNPNDLESTQDKDNRLGVPNAATKRERDRDRFKTIKIVRDHDPNKAGGHMPQAYNVPCIDNNVDSSNVENGFDGGMGLGVGVGVTRNGSYVLDDKDKEQEPDFISTNNNNNNESDFDMNKVNATATTTTTTTTNTNYLTFKYPKDKQNRRNLGLKSIPTIDTQPVLKPPSAATSERVVPPPRSLSRPRYLGGLQKFSAVSKATSAGDLDLTSSNASSQESLSSRKSKINGAGGYALNRTSIAGAAPSTTSSNLKSPMGIKSKSFHNLSNQISSNVGISSNQTRNVQSKLQRPGNKLNTTINCSEPNQNQKTNDSGFKVPKSFVRTSTASGIKRPGLPRPASGYYSLNNIPGKGAFTKVDIADNDNDSSSSTEKTPVESARSSLSVGGQANKVSSEPAKSAANPSSGIPKPSGLRPPSAMKRSGLPRPLSSIKN